MVVGSCGSHNYRGGDWRAGGLAGRRYKCRLKMIDTDAMREYMEGPQPPFLPTIDVRGVF